ncbi:hypothetical protein F5Y15DRAFT_429024 [Xylariaceae sp. FL0016]|nr:hypothetical protein F5Y15DRAFT_429024 [Xylariaceae sp. FL0016]
MSATPTSTGDPEPRPQALHLVGIGVTHSIGRPMHDAVARSLGLPWTFHNTECPSLDALAALARRPATAGLVVTMPYKGAGAMRRAVVDRLDAWAAAAGACNLVYRDARDPAVLVGSNTDWAGVRGALREKGDEARRPREEGEGGERNPPALVVGAGGASRAAVYALSVHLHTRVIYVVNRDEGEVAALRQDVQKVPASPAPVIVHVRSLEQARPLDTPYYVVGTVPDCEPQTEPERTMAEILREFLARPEKGTLVDLCYKPRRTRMIKLAESLGWPTVDGTHVIGHQFEQQWALWVGEEAAAKMDKEAAWRVLMQKAEESEDINF